LLWIQRSLHTHSVNEILNWLINHLHRHETLKAVPALPILKRNKSPYKPTSFWKKAF